MLLAVSDPIRLPALETRTSELLRITEEYAEDARAALSSSAPFTQQDREWVVTRCASSLHEIELATLRLVAIRHAGTVARAAELLGMSHAALGEWFARRRLTTIRTELTRESGNSTMTSVIQFKRKVR